jgi:hypothetical protein
MPFQISKELKRIVQQILRFCFRVACRLHKCICLVPLRAAPHSRDEEGVIIFVDQQKAFDRMEWGWLNYVMECLILD